MAKRKFPTLAVILLVVGVLWLIQELGFLPISNVPWIPAVLIIVAVGLIVNRLAGH